MHDPHMITDILQLSQIVRRHQHRHLLLAHCIQKNIPDLTAHHRIQSVHRLIQYQKLRLTADRQQKGCLLLHSLRHPADISLPVYRRKTIHQLIKKLRIKSRIDPFIILFHFFQICLTEIENIIRYKCEFCLCHRIFKYPFSIHQKLATVLSEYARHMTKQRRLSCSVGSHQTINRSLWYMKARMIKGLKISEPFTYIFSLNQINSPPFFHFETFLIRSINSSGLIPRNLSSFTVLSKDSKSSFFLLPSVSGTPAAKLPLPGIV